MKVSEQQRLQNIAISEGQRVQTADAAGKQFIGVHHIEGHVAANLLEHPDLQANHLTLIVSGGHTMLVEVRRFGSYDILGATRDDALGEAFVSLSLLES